jgi:hypothetical protein
MFIGHDAPTGSDRMLITFAYNVKNFEISGGNGVSSSPQYSAARALQIKATGLSEHWTAAQSVDRGLTCDTCREYYVTGVAFIAPGY